MARLVEDYVRGASVEELIGAFGVNRTTVYAHLDRNSVQRPRGRADQLPTWPDDNVSQQR